MKSLLGYTVNERETVESVVLTNDALVKEGANLTSIPSQTNAPKLSKSLVDNYYLHYGGLKVSSQ